MIINNQEYASVAVVDKDDYLLAVLSDKECVCAGNLKVIAESANGGLVFQDVGNKMVKCFMRKDGQELGEGQKTTLEYIVSTKNDPDTKIVTEEDIKRQEIEEQMATMKDYRVTKNTSGTMPPIMDVISKLPPEVVTSMVQSFLGNAAVSMQNQKKTEEQKEPESQTVEQFEVPESELRNGEE